MAVSPDHKYPLKYGETGGIGCSTCLPVLGSVTVTLRGDPFVTTKPRVGEIEIHSLVGTSGGGVGLIDGAWPNVIQTGTTRTKITTNRRIDLTRTRSATATDAKRQTRWK